MMYHMERVYLDVIKQHFQENNQMLFLTGPRQVGKTTLAHMMQKQHKHTISLNWDIIKDRKLILSGQDFIERIFPLNTLRDEQPLIVFDEIHKYKDWKNYLKGFYDAYKDYYHILVTGSARLDVYKSSGDSLMGRYFVLRIYPLSLRECMSAKYNPNAEVLAPLMPDVQTFAQLYQYGGFPNPYLKADKSFARRWHTLRNKQLFQEDIRDLCQIQEIAQLEVLAELLQHQVGQLLNRTKLATKIQVTVQTISRWLETLERFYFCFALKPWTKNIARSLIKEPKIYLNDWSLIADPGARYENFVAAHLLKAVSLWNDMGLAQYELYYLRDKEKREIDFLVAKYGKAWMLVEAKMTQNQGISAHLYHFQQLTQAPYAFQVVYDMEFVNKSCFASEGIWMVPAKTFLSQLI